MRAFQVPPSRRGISSNSSRASRRQWHLAYDSMARLRRKMGGLGEKVSKCDSTLRASTMARWKGHRRKKRAYREYGKGFGKAKRMEVAFRIRPALR